MQCGISQAKMAVRSNIVERGKQKFDDTGIIKKSWRWEWTEKVVGGEKIALFLRKILTPGVAYCTLCRQEATRLLWSRENKNILRANLLQRKQGRVPYLASSQQSTRDTQFWKCVCRKSVSRYVCEKKNVNILSITLPQLVVIIEFLLLT